jgi:hypothetical protein
MGIRIHKVLGYGLADVKVKNYRIVDDRFNNRGILGREVEEEIEEKFTPEGYEEYCQLNHSYEKDKYFDLTMDRIALRERREKKDHRKHWAVYNSFIHQGEFGLPNVMLVVPCGEYESWYRFDDTIDYYIESIESRKSRKYCISKIDILEDGGIYPWIGNYFNIKTNQKVENGLGPAFWRVINAKRDIAKSRKKNKPNIENPDELAKLMGFDDTTDAIANLRPEVPDCVRAICKYAKVFVDDNVINHLRPMLYTYWS